MSDLTENEIFDCLMSNFKMASENCIRLASTPRKGPAYSQLRDQLFLIEGAARQAMYWRSDTRWLAIANRCSQAHRLSGDWLRLYRNEPRFLYELFTKLAQFLAFGYDLAENIKNEKTGTSGPILPDYMGKKSVKSQNEIAMRISHGGIIIPDGVSI